MKRPIFKVRYDVIDSGPHWGGSHFFICTRLFYFTIALDFYDPIRDCLASWIGFGDSKCLRWQPFYRTTGWI